MEANEAGELQEHAEHGAHEPSMRPVAFTMSVLAVLVAITTVLGHRTHTEAVLNQNKATDEWNYYQAKNIRNTVTDMAAKQLSLTTVLDKDKAAAILKEDADQLKKWKGELKEQQEKAKELESEVQRDEARADRFDLGEALLEIALVTASITLLTRNRIYWMLGLVFGAAGILSACSVLFLH